MFPFTSKIVIIKLYFKFSKHSSKAECFLFASNKRRPNKIYDPIHFKRFINFVNNSFKSLKVYLYSYTLGIFLF